MVTSGNAEATIFLYNEIGVLFSWVPGWFGK